MPRPGIEVSSRAARVARGISVATGTWFITGFAERGPHLTPELVSSLDEFEELFGDRVSYSQLWDALDVYFSEGGGDAWIGRVTGPAPTSGFLVLNDRQGVPAPTLRIEALDVGAFSADLTVEVQDGTLANTFRLIVRYEGSEIERFDNLVMEPATDASYAPTVLAASSWIRGIDQNSAAAGAVANPAVLAATPLSAGTDDRAAATDADWLEALGLFTRDLGSGQVSAPGRTTTAAHQQLIDHAAANNRTAYLDSADRATEAALNAAVDAIETYANAETAGLFGTWADGPGVSESGGVVRGVPGSAFVAARTAATDRLFGVAGIAPAGAVKGLADYVLDIRQPTPALDDDAYEDLNLNGVNMIRNFRGIGVVLYGFRSISKNADWVQLSAHRERMALTAELEAVAQRFVFEQNTATTRADFNAALTGVCLRHYRAGALFGDTPEEAFSVITDESVNTVARIQAGELHASVLVRVTPFAEFVKIDLVKLPLTAQVA